jgi:UDP-N-acetylmuramoyl-tripeptide--D-alanyl-D-alanine ligase
MKKLIQLKLKILSKAILSKYKPDIIGITGSVGKTGAKEAVYTVLSSKFNVRKSIKNYNNEIGVPLTVIGSEAKGKSIFGWIGVFLKALKLILFRDKNYPKILILEMGVDKPGDMKYLLGIVKPKVGVITKIGESHLEFFNSIDEIQKEKELLVKQLTESGIAILNCDDLRVKTISNIKAKVITYGFRDECDINAREIDAKNLKEVNFKLAYKGSTILTHLPNVIGRTAIETVLAGIAVGIAFNMNLTDIGKALKKYKPPKGRMNLIAGVKNTYIIDDTYNSSPQSSLAALDAIDKIKLTNNARKFAVLGDMLELGSYTEVGHRLAGRKAAEAGINKLIVVGEKARDIASGAEEAGMKKDDIFHFPNSDDARIFVQERIEEGDLILVKGSQGIRMEKIVVEIMAEPLRAGELLVRQGSEWKD